MGDSGTRALRLHLADSQQMQTVQPLAKFLKRLLQLRFDFRRHPFGLRKQLEQVRVAALRFRNEFLGVFSVGKAALSFSNIGEREACCKIRSDKINDRWSRLSLEPRETFHCVSHT